MSSTTNATKHTCEPGDRAFGKRAPGCARCTELAGGAPARRGWGARKAEEERKLIAAIRAHNCIERKCGPVCTAFDW